MPSHMSQSPPPRPPAGTRPSFGYIPALDGLRACAVLIVLAAHFGFFRWVPGGFGVTLFFFISGMLITRLLLAEQAARGRIDVGRFYARRMLRLYPALLVAVVAGALAILAASGSVPWGKIAAALFYVINYYGIYIGWSQGFSGFDPMAVLWSLAIEEQYYIVFPLVALALAGQPRRFLGWVAAGVLAVLAWRILLVTGGADSDRIYMGTDTRIDSILYGCLLTLLLAQTPANAERWLRRLARPLVVVAAVAVLLASFVVRDALFRDTLRYTVQGLALMPIVAALCFTDRLRTGVRLLESAPMRHIGRLSYSLYLLHPIAIALAEWTWGPGSQGPQVLHGAPFLGFLATAVLLSVVLAELSYRCVEMPFVQWRRRFGSHPVEGRA